MAKVWNTGSGNGDELGTPTVKRRDPIDNTLKEFVRIPGAHSGCFCDVKEAPCRCGRDQYVEHKAGNVYFAAHGYQFAVIPRNSSFDIPAGLSLKSLQDQCPHLVSQEDYELKTVTPEQVKAEKAKQAKSSAAPQQ